MRHGKKFNHLSRTTSHRAAMLSNMASSLILSKRISTTVAKAKALRKYVEPLLTKSKTDDTNSRRVVFSYLQNKESVSELFNVVAEKIATRPGGYTRILKTGNRFGDNAEMCIIELVDYNDLMQKEAKEEKPKTRRSRRGGAKKEEAAKVEAKAEEVISDAEVVEEEAKVEESTEETEKEETSNEENTSEESDSGDEIDKK
ncbi:MAG: 50S ribosomal protein L17 [Cyclobacteriaceae bacterium]|nr:50S ribosomal protein L17 [Cyclobacteriaceae bacterium]